MHLLDSLEVEAFSETLETLLDKAAEVSCGEYSAKDLLQAAAEAKLSVFVPALDDLSAVLVVDILTSFRRQYVMVLALAGDVQKLYKEQVLFNHWARFLGCSEVRMACSESRERLFKKQGFKRLYAVCGYSLEDET